MFYLYKSSMTDLKERKNGGEGEEESNSKRIYISDNSAN